MNNPKLVSIQSMMNNKAITLVSKDNPDKKGGKAQVWDFQNRPEQLFLFNCVEGNKYVIRCSAMNGWVLDLHKQRETVYNSINGYQYHGKANQKWLLQQSTKFPGWHFIISVKSGYVMEIQGGIDANGMDIVQNQNFGNKNQLWKIQEM